MHVFKSVPETKCSNLENYKKLSSVRINSQSSTEAVFFQKAACFDFDVCYATLFLLFTSLIFVENCLSIRPQAHVLRFPCIKISLSVRLCIEID